MPRRGRGPPVTGRAAPRRCRPWRPRRWCRCADRLPYGRQLRPRPLQVAAGEGAPGDPDPQDPVHLGQAELLGQPQRAAAQLVHPLVLARSLGQDHEAVQALHLQRQHRLLGPPPCDDDIGTTGDAPPRLLARHGVQRQVADHRVASAASTSVRSSGGGSWRRRRASRIPRPCGRQVPPPGQCDRDPQANGRTAGVAAVREGGAEIRLLPRPRAVHRPASAGVRAASSCSPGTQAGCGLRGKAGQVLGVPIPGLAGGAGLIEPPGHELADDLEHPVLSSGAVLPDRDEPVVDEAVGRRGGARPRPSAPAPTARSSHQRRRTATRARPARRCRAGPSSR